jgi:gliding motility-associated-like protein
MPKETTTYTIEVANEGGCTVKDDITIHVFCNNGNLFLPNTFSPNRDGANEFFYPRGSGVFTVKSFRIFDRWGALVFERNDFQPNNRSSGWNGMYGNRPASQDVYVYTVEIICENRVVLNFKGNVVLIR